MFCIGLQDMIQKKDAWIWIIKFGNIIILLKHNCVYKHAYLFIKKKEKKKKKRRKMHVKNLFNKNEKMISKCEFFDWNKHKVNKNFMTYVFNYYYYYY